MTHDSAIPKAISKVLSRNDTGATGGHQAGILVPKDPRILSFFPRLDSSTKNPRARMSVSDPQGRLWRFMFIYYNNKRFGGTRNEYRLTWMTTFVKQHNLREGDKLTLLRDNDGTYSIDWLREGLPETGVLRLGSTWKVVRI